MNTEYEKISRDENSKNVSSELEEKRNNLYKNAVAEGDRRREKERRRMEDLYRKGWYRLQDKSPKSTPWLVIRCSLNDVGLRPIPTGEAHWRSPDIWVESSDPTGNAVAGENNFLHVRIFNLGMAHAAPVKIDYYWANPALGLGPVNMNLIGTEWVEVKSQSSKIVRCSTPWVPTFVNNGHECLMVNCSNHILDPILHPFEPRIDRHVGQRNITVLEASAGETIQFNLEINNIFPILTQTSIIARSEHVLVTKQALKKLNPVQLINEIISYGDMKRTTAEQIERLYRKGTAEFRVARTVAKMKRSHSRVKDVFVHGFDEYYSPLKSAVCISASLSDKVRTLVPTGERSQQLSNYLLAKDKMISDTACIDKSRYALLKEFTQKPFEQHRMDLELGIPASAKAGEYIVFHLEHRAEEMALGGYSIVVHITDKIKERRKGMAQLEQGKEDILKLIVQEVDEARETYEVVMQLMKAFPIGSFKDIQKVFGDKGTITFRGNPFEVDMFEGKIPDFIFPINDIRSLIELVYMLVRAAPPTISYDMRIPENAKRHVKRLQIKSLIPSGAIGSAAFPIGAGGALGESQLTEEKKTGKEEH